MSSNNLVAFFMRKIKKGKILTKGTAYGIIILKGDIYGIYDYKRGFKKMEY